MSSYRRLAYTLNGWGGKTVINFADFHYRVHESGRKIHMKNIRGRQHLYCPLSVRHDKSGEQPLTACHPLIYKMNGMLADNPGLCVGVHSYHSRMCDSEQMQTPLFL